MHARCMGVTGKKDKERKFVWPGAVPVLRSVWWLGEDNTGLTEAKRPIIIPLQQQACKL